MMLTINFEPRHGVDNLVLILSSSLFLPLISPFVFLVDDNGHGDETGGIINA